MATSAQPISAKPADKQIIEHNGKRFTTVKEGLAHILVPAPEGSASGKKGDEVQQVFYNPIQQFNRDLTILAIKAYGKATLNEKKRKTWKDSLEDRNKRKRAKDEDGSGQAAKMRKTASEAPAPDGPDNQAPEPSEPITDKMASNGQDSMAAIAESSEPKRASAPPPFRILDALSASGLRALRYAHEIPFVTEITSNDLGKSAVESIKLNVQHNNLESKITVSHDDALAHMYDIAIRDARRLIRPEAAQHSGKYNVIDLDPYGTAAPFFDAALQAVKDGGLLCVTCTDSGVWASAGYAEKCYALYGGVPVKGWYSHEAGIRIVLYGLQTAAARYGLTIEPVLSLSIDYYIRAFVKVKRSPAQVKFQAGKNMVVYACDSGCGAWETQPLMKNRAAPNKKGSGIFYKHVLAPAPTIDHQCAHCHSTMHLAGPMFGGYLHSPAFIRSVLAEVSEASTEIYGTTERIRGMLQTALEEVEDLKPKPQAGERVGGEAALPLAISDHEKQQAELAVVDPYPFYFDPGHLAGVLRCITPSDAALRGALMGLGYRTTRSHCKAGSIKTDAPWSVVWRIMKEWVRQKAPIKESNLSSGSPGARLLGLAHAQQGAKSTEDKKTDTGEPKEEQPVVFDEALGRRKPDAIKLARYPPNPRDNWGPMSRAKAN